MWELFVQFPKKILSSFFLSDDVVCVIMPKDMPIAERKEVPLKLLADYPLVLYRDDFNMHDDILQNCEKIGFCPKLFLKPASAS